MLRFALVPLKTLSDMFELDQCHNLKILLFLIVVSIQNSNFRISTAGNHIGSIRIINNVKPRKMFEKSVTK